MSFSKVHDDFHALIDTVSPLARRCVTGLVRHINHDGKVHLHDYHCGKNPITFAQSLMRLTGSDKARISKTLKELRDAGIIESVGRSYVTFSGSLIRRNSRRFSERNYKLTEDIMASRVQHELYYEIPTLYTREETVHPLLKKEFDDIKNRIDDRFARIEDGQNTIKALVLTLRQELGIDDLPTIEKIVRKFTLIKSEI